MSGATALGWGLDLAQSMLVLAMTLAVWRMMRGPRAQDRILGLDTFYLNGMLAIVVHGSNDAGSMQCNGLDGLVAEGQTIRGNENSRLP